MANPFQKQFVGTYELRDAISAEDIADVDNLLCDLWLEVAELPIEDDQQLDLQHKLLEISEILRVKTLSLQEQVLEALRIWRSQPNAAISTDRVLHDQILNMISK